MSSGSHSIDLGVPADEVWKVLVAPGRRNWYYGLTAQGEFESGSHQLIQAEGGAQLLGLRLAADPSARAELERLTEIGEVEIRDVTPALISAYHHFFDDVAFRDFPAWQSCYCMETHRTQSDEEWALRTGADNRRDMSDSISQGSYGRVVCVRSRPTHRVESMTRPRLNIAARCPCICAPASNLA